MQLNETPDNRLPQGTEVYAAHTRGNLRIRAMTAPALTPEARGTVVFLNGRADFVERYFETMADMQARGFHVAGFDWRGHYERFPYTGKTAREDCSLVTHVVNNAMAIKAHPLWWRLSGDERDRRDPAQHVGAQRRPQHRLGGVDPCGEQEHRDDDHARGALAWLLYTSPSPRDS